MLYVFCINAAELPDSGFRTELKDMISGEDESVSAPSEKLKLYVSDTDYALIRYAEKVCQTLRESGLDISGGLDYSKLRTSSCCLLRLSFQI